MASTPLLNLGKSLLAAALAVCATAATAADPFPNRPVRIIVNTVPGGLTDIVARLVGQKMRDTLGQAVIVDNRAGADGLLGIRAVKTAPADGYTLLATAGTIAIQPAVKQDAGYDLVKDFAGIGPVIRSPLMVVVGADQPDKTLADFVGRAKGNPDKLSYASAGIGTTTHIGAAMYMQQAGLKVLHVPYKGNAAAMSDVISGRVDMIFEAYGSGSSKVREGRLRALAVTSANRLPGFPDVPTIAEQGVPGYSYYLWIGLLAPAGTPHEVVQRLSEGLRAALASKDLSERFRSDGAEPMPMSSEQFDDFLRRDVADMARLVKDVGIPKQ